MVKKIIFLLSVLAIPTLIGFLNTQNAGLFSKTMIEIETSPPLKVTPIGLKQLVLSDDRCGPFESIDFIPLMANSIGTPKLMGTDLEIENEGNLVRILIQLRETDADQANHLPNLLRERITSRITKKYPQFLVECLDSYSNFVTIRIDSLNKVPWVYVSSRVENIKKDMIPFFLGGFFSSGFLLVILNALRNYSVLRWFRGGSDNSKP